MLPSDRALWNAHRTLNASGIYGARVGCMASDGEYACGAAMNDGWASMRCSGESQRLCTIVVHRRRK